MFYFVILYSLVSLPLFHEITQNPKLILNFYHFRTESGFHGKLTRVQVWQRALDAGTEIPRQVRSCRSAAILFDGLILRWSGKIRIHSFIFIHFRSFSFFFAHFRSFSFIFIHFHSCSFIFIHSFQDMTKLLEELRESCLQSVAQKLAHLVTLEMNVKFWKKTKSHPLLNTVHQV